MRANIILSALFLSHLIAGAQQVNRGLNIVHLTGGLYVFTTYHSSPTDSTPSNGMYLVTENHVVLFDTPWDPQQFQPLLDSIEQKHHKRVIACLITHYHMDRIAGLPYYKAKGIVTWSSILTGKLSREKQLMQADQFFINDTTFTIDNDVFQTYYPGPGHTEDNIVIWFPREKVLYGGCLIKSTDYKALGQIPDSDLNGWAESVRRLNKKYPDADYVIPGHYGWANKNSLEHTIDLVRRKRREGQ